MQDWNDSDLAQFRNLIDQRLAELAIETERGKSGEAVVELDQQSVGRLSRMDALQYQAMAKAQQGRRSTEITRLSRALSRLEAGDFGYCDDCGDPIPRKRLALDLAATRCVSCASG